LRGFVKEKWASQSPFFFGKNVDGLGKMADLWSVVETAAQDLGFELIDVERTPGGILRVFIDVIDGSRHITVDDCESLSRQLVHLLPVEGFDFQRLEVSSPGFDRPLTKASHYQRFAGEQIKLRLKVPLEGRRNFDGQLQVAEDGSLSVVYEGKGGVMLQLDFEIDDVERARLVPQVGFRRNQNES
jgi:ribosome maturation factor RimP